MRLTGWIFALAALPVAAISTSAQASDPFYAGKTISIYVGSSPGAGYDLYARLLSRFLAKHLAGGPSVVVKNMAGAGGMTVANWIYNVAPRDGTAVATFGRGIAFETLLNPKQASFDGRKFGWIGSMSEEVSVCATTAASGFAKFEEVFSKELVVGASGAGGDTFIFP